MKNLIDNHRPELTKDSDLAAPYEDTVKRIALLETRNHTMGTVKLEELSQITQVVEDARSRFFARIEEELLKRNPRRQFTRDGHFNKPRFTDLPIIERQDILRSLSAEYAAAVEMVAEECLTFDGKASVSKIAASYAHILTCDGKRDFRYVVVWCNSVNQS